jgi:integrase
MNFVFLLGTVRGDVRVMILLAASVGLRRSEFFGLKWSDFNWLLREIFMQRSHVEGYEDETKTDILTHSRSQNPRKHCPPSSFTSLPLNLEVLLALQNP